MDNLSNKAPPLIYQNGLNYNVDTATYDTLGRYCGLAMPRSSSDLLNL